MKIPRLYGFKAIVALPAASLIMPPLTAQDSRQEKSTTITVEGVREQDVERIIGDIAPSRGGRQIAKWQWGVCVKVFGLKESHAAFLRDRVKSTAKDLNIWIEKKEDCEPNITILFTDKSRDILLQIKRRYPDMLRDPRFGFAKKSEWEQFLMPRPVTWMGRDETDISLSGGAASRIKQQTRQALTATLAVIDANDISGITWGQLADYLCMVTLSRPLLNATYGSSTILGLFAMRDLSRPTPAGLTKMDKSILENLYTMEARFSASTQKSILRRKVVEELVKAKELNSSDSVN